MVPTLKRSLQHTQYNVCLRYHPFHVSAPLKIITKVIFGQNILFKIISLESNNLRLYGLMFERILSFKKTSTFYSNISSSKRITKNFVQLSKKTEPI